MKPHTCVVVAHEETTRIFLATLLQSSGLETIFLTSLGELAATLATVPTSGVLLELASLVTASAKDKKAVQELLEYYPYAKFRFDRQQVLLLGETLEHFCAKCLQFAPRVTRKSVRREVHLAVLLSSSASFARAEKSVTINVSDQGIFVYSARKWKVGQHVWLQFPGDESVYLGIVRFYEPWGNSRSFPGIGIEFEETQTGWSDGIAPAENEMGKEKPI